MELKDINNKELVELLLERTKELRDINMYEKIQLKRIFDGIDMILDELKKRAEV